METTYHLELKEAWALRNSQNLDSAEQALRKLSSYQGDLSWAHELKFLEASILRARKRVEESEHLLVHVKTDIDATNQPVPFQYYLQRGLNLFYQGYFPSALEFFARAQELAQEPEMKILALGNQSLCLDNLNLPLASVIEKMKALSKDLPEAYYQKVIAPQFETFQCRQSFRIGDISKAFHLQRRDLFSQVEYFQLWMKHLPYLDGNLCQTDLSRMIEAPHIIWKNYRLHTLLLDSRYQTEEDVKISEQIDRLYSWLWRWMLQPQQISLSVIEDCWAQLNARRMCSQSTAEDFLLVKTCLRWTRLFDSRWELPSEEWLLKSTPPSLNEYPLFKLEGQVLDYFEALKEKNTRKARSIYESLQSNELFQNPHLFFKDILLGAQGESEQNVLNKFGRRLAARFKTRSVVVPANSLHLNMESSQWKTAKDEGVSKSLCVLITSLMEQTSLTFKQVMTLCFEIKFYDEDIHRNKVMNLLTRLRKILPEEVQIFTKDQRVYIQGPLNRIRVQNSENETVVLELPLIFDKPCLDQNQYFMDRWIQPRLVLKKLKGKERITRQELQDLLGLSKATTNRLLNRWIDEGFLQKLEKGRNVSYLVDNRYFIRLNSSDS